MKVEKPLMSNMLSGRKPDGSVESAPTAMDRHIAPRFTKGLRSTEVDVKRLRIREQR